MGLYYRQKLLIIGFANNWLMSKIVVFDEDYAKVSYVPDYKLVQIVWSGTITIEQYQRVFTLTLDFQEKELVPIHNFMSDVRNQGVVNPENRKWFETYALPRAVKQGLRRGAVVFDGNVFKKYYLNLILQSTSRFNLPFKFFSEPNEALIWFKSFEE